MERFKHKVQNLLFTQSKSMYTDKQCLLKAQISQIPKLQISSRANQNSLNQKPKKTKIMLHI